MGIDSDSFCPTCGAKVVEYKHSLSKGLVRALWRVGQQGKKLVKISELDLSHTQQANFQKIRYWGLARPVAIDGVDRSGFWELTEKGWDFLFGRERVPKSVWTYRGNPVRFDGKEVSIEDVTDGYRLHSDYVADAVPH